VKIKLHVVTCFLLASPTFHAALSIQHVALASYPSTDLDIPLGLQEVQAARTFRQSAHASDKAVSPTHRPLLPSGRYPWYSFLLQAGRPRSHSAAERIKSMKKSQ